MRSLSNTRRTESRLRTDQVAADWSVNFDLDALVQTVVQFSKSHQHIESPPERVFRLD